MEPIRQAFVDFWNMFPRSFREAVKELLRNIMLAVVPIVMLGVDEKAMIVHVNWIAIKFTVVFAVLRFVDKWLHEWGKDNYNDSATKGLTRF